MEKYSKFTLVTFLIIILNVSLIVPLVNGQPDDEYLPVLLIHGYASDASVWNNWLVLLGNEGITAHAVTFPDDPTTPIDEDKCGRAVDHAAQLNKIIESFKKQTGKEKINIVTHSKGGLDSRVYLANNQSNTLVANLIMIGTPNHGSPLAWGTSMITPYTVPLPFYPILAAFFCLPAAHDLIPGTEATLSVPNENTNYYTIAGDWTPEPYFVNMFVYPYFFPVYDSNCLQSSWLTIQRWGNNDFVIPGQDDGLVPLRSAVSQEFTNLGISDNCHTNLLTEQLEYNWAKEILKPE